MVPRWQQESTAARSATCIYFFEHTEKVRFIYGHVIFAVQPENIGYSVKSFKKGEGGGGMEVDWKNRLLSNQSWKNYFFPYQANNLVVPPGVTRSRSRAQVSTKWFFRSQKVPSLPL